MTDNWANSISTTLNGGINNAVTSITVTSSTGFPATPFNAKIVAEGANASEIINVTNVAGTTWTVTRASESYAGSASASAHGTGAAVQHVLTAASVAAIQTAAGTKHSYIGYNTIGGTSLAPNVRRCYAKQVTTAVDGWIGSIQIYLTESATGHVYNFVGAVWADNSGAVGKLLSFGSIPTGSANFAPLASSSGWVGAPSSPIFCTAGTYWIGIDWNFSSSGAAISMFRDASGTDRTFDPSGDFVSDGGVFTQTNSTFKFSIRADFKPDSGL